MELSKVQKMLIESLKQHGADKELIIIIMLMLQKSEDAMFKLGAWIANEKNPSPNDILVRAVEIEQNLPPELRTGDEQ